MEKKLEKVVTLKDPNGQEKECIHLENLSTAKALYLPYKRLTTSMILNYCLQNLTNLKYIYMYAYAEVDGFLLSEVFQHYTNICTP